MLPKCFGVRYSRYLQCYQQNTNPCALFAASILYFQYFMNSLRKNTGGGGYVHKKIHAPRSYSVSNEFECARPYRFYRCPEAAGNPVCWDGGIGTSPLRSRQRMEFNTPLLASSAWRQFIAADAFAPGAVAALLLKMSPLRRLLSSASNGCCPVVPENRDD